MLDFITNLTSNRGKYKNHSEAAIISCFYNPQNNPYRLLAFQKFYSSINHLNYKIIECLVGKNAKAQLPNDPNIIRVKTPSLLWHKEALLNKVIKTLPPHIKYVFWIDADVLFMNKNWLIDGVKQLKKGTAILQPFEYCIHLEKNELKPSFNIEQERKFAHLGKKDVGDNKRMWRSFCSNNIESMQKEDYDVHGHVGFAWGAHRELLEKCPLYKRALIGGADHIIAHAAVGQIPHPCISKSFTDDIDDVIKWSKYFYTFTQAKVGYVPGDLYHIWHGDIKKRQYLKRIKDFTADSREIKEIEDDLYVSKNDLYVREYMRDREVFYDESFDFGDLIDDSFVGVMGYAITDVFNLFGPPFNEDQDSYVEPSFSESTIETQENFS